MGGGCSRRIAVVDLNECDREPIQIPGTIQPFGVLFALDEEMKVAQVSENVSDHLSLRVDEVLGRPLSDSVDPAGAEGAFGAARTALARREPAEHRRVREAIRRYRSPTRGRRDPQGFPSQTQRHQRNIRSITRSAPHSCACSARAR